MSTVHAPLYNAVVKDTGRFSGHQPLRAPTQATFIPTHYTPVPVASALKGGTTGTAYSESITAQGGTSPYTFAVTSGALPTGCSMSSGGSITGTPAVAATASFTVTVTDANGYTGSQAFSIIIATASSGGGAYAYVFVS
jgi:hypothetical protein